MENIRKAGISDASRIAEIEIFNYRLNFYPVFRNDEYYFGELQVISQSEKLAGDIEALENIYVYDDGVVKGFASVEGDEIKKLFVEPCLQGQGIGEKLLSYAVEAKGANHLWALEKNTRAVAFYLRHGFEVAQERKYEEDTTEYLVRLNLRR